MGAARCSGFFGGLFFRTLLGTTGMGICHFWEKNVSRTTSLFLTSDVLFIMSWYPTTVATTILPRTCRVWRSYSRKATHIWTEPGVVLTTAERRRLQAALRTPQSKYLSFNLQAYVKWAKETLTGPDVLKSIMPQNILQKSPKYTKK